MVLGGDNESFGIKARKTRIDDVRNRSPAVAVDLASCPFDESENFGFDPASCRVAVRMVGKCQTRGLAESSHECDGHRSRTNSALLTAAEHQRSQRGTIPPVPLAGHEGSDTLRGVDLVAADAHEIHSRVAEHREFLTEALRGVHMEERVVILEGRAYLIERLDHPGLIVDVHHRHEKCVGTDSFRDLIGVDRAVVT